MNLPSRASSCILAETALRITRRILRIMVRFFPLPYSARQQMLFRALKAFQLPVKQDTPYGRYKKKGYDLLPVSLGERASNGEYFGE